VIKEKYRSGLVQAGICLGLVALVWAVFGQTLGHDFINYDDNDYVYANEIVKAGITSHGVVLAFLHAAPTANWHPLTIISHMLDCEFYGLDPAGHHFTNVLLHAIGTILLFLLICHMTRALWRAAFVAAVFAIHPLHVESVAWVAERKDVLSGIFFMLTLLAYVHYTRQPSLGRYFLTSLVLLLGLMSKPMLVTTPVVLLLLDYWPLSRFLSPGLPRSGPNAISWLNRQPTSIQLILEKIPFLVLTLGSCVATLVAQRGAISPFKVLPLSWRISNAFISYVTYVWQTLAPNKLAVFYPHPQGGVPAWELLVSVAILVTITIEVFGLRKMRPYLLFGWLWYLIMLLPVIGLIQVGVQARADRYTYLPQIGLYLALTWMTADLAATARYWLRTVAVAATIYLALLSWKAWAQTQYWQNSQTLWNHALAVTSNNSEAHKNLGAFLLNKGYTEQAVAHYKEVLAMDPKDVKTRDDLGVALARLKRFDEAVEQWNTSLSYQAEDGNAQINIAWILATAPDPSQRDGTRAVELAEHAVRSLGSSKPQALRTLAAAYAENGRFTDAISVTRRALELANHGNNVSLVEELRRNVGQFEKGLPLRDDKLANFHGRH